jgi:hypothetical protein
MESALARLAGFMSRHRRAVAAACVVLFAAGGWFWLRPNDRPVPPAPSTQPPALLEHLEATRGVVGRPPRPAAPPITLAP